MIVPPGRQGFILLALGAALLSAGCGSGSNGDAANQLAHQQQLDRARAAGARSARQNARIRELERQVNNQGTNSTSTPSSTSSASSSAGVSTSGPVTCDGGLTAGSHTSCAFASNVRSAYEQSGGSGDRTLDVYSPVTNRTYSMTCTGGEPHVCTGGNDAAVFFP